MLSFRALCTKPINNLFNLYLRLRNKRTFSILCSNCIGGIIYNRLGLKFESPTINLWIPYKDFYRLCERPKYYFDKRLLFIDDNSVDYPVAMLDDIRINFNHSKTREEAANDWNRRKERLDINNLYIITYERMDITREDLIKLSKVKCKKLIVLTEKRDNIDLPFMKYIKRDAKGRPDAQVFLDKNIFGIRTFERKWDFVKWLNT